MSVRHSAPPPLYTRLSRRLFLRWAAQEVRAERFGAWGEGTIVFPPALILGHERIELGRGVVILPGAFLSVVGEEGGRRYEGRLVVGDGARIGSDIVVACAERVEIGARVLTADRVFIGDTYHEYRDVSRAVLDQGLHDPQPVSIGDGAFLGINCAILPGVTVGEGAYIGAGAVVTEDVPPHSVVVGNPGRVIRRWDGERWVAAGGGPPSALA